MLYSHAPKSSASCLYTVFALTSRFSTKKVVILQMCKCKKHSSSGSPHARFSACTSDREWCQALVIFLAKRSCSQVLACDFLLSPKQARECWKNPPLRHSAAADRRFLPTDVRNNTRWCVMVEAEKRSGTPRREARNPGPLTPATAPIGYYSARPCRTTTTTARASSINH